MIVSSGLQECQEVGSLRFRCFIFNIFFVNSDQTVDGGNEAQPLALCVDLPSPTAKKLIDLIRRFVKRILLIRIIKLSWRIKWASRRCA